MSGHLFIISAPSGAGKTSLVTALSRADKQLTVSVSHTTRAPRPAEVQGSSYFFVSKVQFDEMMARGDFLESAEVFDNQYGTSKSWVDAQLSAGFDVILEIDWQGAEQVQKSIECSSIFILPPSLEALEQRIRARQQDSDEVIERRLAGARLEMSHWQSYDYLVVNEDFDQAKREIAAIIQAQRLRVTHQSNSKSPLIRKMLDAT